MLTRLQREKDFHNERFEKGTRGVGLPSDSAGPAKYYTIVLKALAYQINLLRQWCEGKKVLEYGCGVESLAFYMTKAAQVTGIDISEVAVEQAAKQARRQGLDWLHFRVMDAENLAFDDSEFDLVCGTAILHHLDLKRSFAELARTLRPDGVGVFLEPLGHNPVINLYRKMTPNLRTADEHPLLRRDLDLARRYFGKVDLRFFNLFSLLAIAAHKYRCFPALHKALNAVDELVFRVVPPARLYAWNVVLVLSHPIKAKAEK